MAMPFLVIRFVRKNQCHRQENYDILTNDKVTRRMLFLIELVGELRNVSKACNLRGYSRRQFFEIRRNYQTCGVEGLMDRPPGSRGAHPNRVSEEFEIATLGRHKLLHRTARPLRLERHVSDDTPFELTDEQVKALERFSPEFRERHSRSRCACPQY